MYVIKNTKRTTSRLALTILLPQSKSLIELNFLTKQVDNTKLSVPCEEVACKVNITDSL